MPYTLKKNKFKYKNPDTGNYEGVDVVAERSFADYQSALETVGLQQQTVVRSEGTTQKNAVTAAGTAAAANFPATAAACDTLAGDFAATYVPDQAYAVGDYCTYQYQLYQCKTAIVANTDHTFVTSHWNLITVTDTINDQVDDLKTQMNDISAPVKNLFDKNNVNVFDDARLTNSHQGSGTIKASSGAKTIYIPCEPNTNYTISKVITNQFSFGYTNVAPEIGTEVPYAKTARTSTSITITTGANAKYLVAYVYLDTESSPESLTFEAVCDTIQIELGKTATSYTPYKLTAVDDISRNNITAINNSITEINGDIGDIETDIGDINTNLGKLENRIDTKKIVISSNQKIATLGDEMISDFSAMTAIGGASYSDGVWDLPVDGGISTTLNVDADTTYLIQLGVVNGSVVISDYSTNLRVNPLTITFGNDSLSIFANGDANWNLCLKPAVSGSATLSIVCEDLLSLKMNGLSVKAVTGYADTPFSINGVRTYMNNHNIAVGNGQTKEVVGDYNTAVGRGAQYAVDTGYANTAVGFSAQNALLNGRANCAIGNIAQSRLTTGMYNNAIGTVAQGNPGGNLALNLKMTGCWNNAMGNEAQRDLTSGHNNTGIGRRAQSYLTTGCENTAFGSLAGFTQINGHGSHGGYATKTANFQTLIGAESIQADSTNGEHDYATALGYKTYVGTKALALGAEAEATGEKSVAIGYGVQAVNDNEVVIGDSDSSIILAGKRIIFNQDGTVTWTAVTP